MLTHNNSSKLKCVDMIVVKTFMRVINHKLPPHKP